MSRVLNEKDREILIKLAPEIDGLCPGSGHEYYSVLPPVSNHYAKDECDFLERIKKLSGEEITYLANLILAGGESIQCVRPEHIILFAEQVSEKVSQDIGRRIVELYQSGDRCED
jgi:hypothetical protein